MPQEFTDDETDVEQWTREAETLNENRAIFEAWCGACMRALPGETVPYKVAHRYELTDGVCDCAKPDYIFVGESTADACAWEAAGILLELVQRAAIIIKKQGDELDQEAARDVRDGEVIEQLRAKVDEQRREIEAYRKDKF